MTTAQLTQLGLLGAALSMNLPQITRHCRTRVTQQGSASPLTFVSLHEAVLKPRAQALMHLAGVAEARLLMGALQDGQRFEVLSTAGRPAGHQPDAEVISGGPNDCWDYALEFDAGYPTRRVEQKLRAFAEQGYAGILWATSVHGRVDTIVQQIAELQEIGALPGIKRFEVAFVDFWTEHRDPYAERPRCHKSFQRSSKDAAR